MIKYKQYVMYKIGEVIDNYNCREYSIERNIIIIYVSTVQYLFVHPSTSDCMQ